jgi:hypothetical protein
LHDVLRNSAWPRDQPSGNDVGPRREDAGSQILLQGYEGMKAREGKIPAPYKKRIGEAAASIVSLYDACGKKELADQWRRRLETPAQKAAPGR